MAASVQYRQQERSLGGRMMVKEKDDDLPLFLEMQSSDQENNNPSLVHNSEGLDDLIGLEPESFSILKKTNMINGPETIADDFLNSENIKNDHEWFLTAPDTFSSLEINTDKTVTAQMVDSTARATSQQSRLANPCEEPATRTNKSSKRPTSSNAVKSSTAATRKPSPMRAPTSTTCRSTTPAARPTVPSTTKPSRSSTPTSRETLAATKPMAPPKRSSTPTIPAARSSTPTARPSVNNSSKTTSRSSTPTHRLSATSGAPTISGPTARSSSVTKSWDPRATASKVPMPSRGSSPSVKSRPSMNHFDLPERPASVPKGRPGGPNLKLSSVEINANGKQRMNSRSPLRVKLSNGTANNTGRSGNIRTREHCDGSDDVNPVLMGTKMVERVVNMRKLAPPKQDNPHSNPSAKSSSSQDNSGFGRSLSKKSLDMALRHMDIRRSMPGNLRAMITKVPASSMYSVRPDSTKSKTVSSSDSPLAASSYASSECSVSNNGHAVDGSEVGDGDLGSENGHHH